MEKHVRAFVRVHVAVSDHFPNVERPALSYVQWPWPLVPDVAAQYVLLLKRVRNREKVHHCFSSTPKVQVRRVAFRSTAEKILARNSILSERILWLIFACLDEGRDLKLGEGASFTVSSQSLCLPGWTEDLKPHATQRAESYTLSRPVLKKGNVVALSAGPMRNCLVVI